MIVNGGIQYAYCAMSFPNCYHVHRQWFDDSVFHSSYHLDNSYAYNILKKKNRKSETERICEI